jgi:hypothetical protein
MTPSQAHRVFARLRAGMAVRYPAVASVALRVQDHHFLRHPKARDLAWYDIGTRTVHLVSRALAGPDGRVAGLLAHELGHAADPVPDAPYAERRADAMAKKALGKTVRYDEDDVQNLKRGVSPRPARLPENRPRGTMKNPVSKQVRLRQLDREIERREAVGLPVAHLLEQRDLLAKKRNPAKVYDSNWADFAKAADVGELDLDAIAYDTGYDNFRNLDLSVSPRTIARERKTPSGAKRFQKFAKAIREHSLKLEGASEQQIANALEGIKSNPAVIATIYAGYRVKNNETGEIWTVMGAGPKVRGIYRYVVKDSDGKMWSLKREALLQGQKDGTLTVLDIANRNPAKGYKMPEAQARHTAEGLLARMKADGADTFAKKVKWVKKHMPNIDRPRTFVGWVTKGERGRVVYQRNPKASVKQQILALDRRIKAMEEAGYAPHSLIEKRDLLVAKVRRRKP